LQELKRKREEIFEVIDKKECQMNIVSIFEGEKGFESGIEAIISGYVLGIAPYFPHTCLLLFPMLTSSFEQQFSQLGIVDSLSFQLSSFLHHRFQSWSPQFLDDLESHIIILPLFSQFFSLTSLSSFSQDQFNQFKQFKQFNQFNQFNQQDKFEQIQQQTNELTNLFEEIYQLSDIIVNGMRGEEEGIFILEALARGIPVITPYHSFALDLPSPFFAHQIKDGTLQSLQPQFLQKNCFGLSSSSSSSSSSLSSLSLSSLRKEELIEFLNEFSLEWYMIQSVEFTRAFQDLLSHHHFYTQSAQHLFPFIHQHYSVHSISSFLLSRLHS
jgi:hypothetical protein